MFAGEAEQIPGPAGGSGPSGGWGYRSPRAGALRPPPGRGGAGDPWMRLEHVGAPPRPGRKRGRERSGPRGGAGKSTVSGCRVPGPPGPPRPQDPPPACPDPVAPTPRPQDPPTACPGRPEPAVAPGPYARLPGPPERPPWPQGPPSRVPGPWSPSLRARSPEPPPPPQEPRPRARPRSPPSPSRPQDPPPACRGLRSAAPRQGRPRRPRKSRSDLAPDSELRGTVCLAGGRGRTWPGSEQVWGERPPSSALRGGRPWRRRGPQKADAAPERPEDTWGEGELPAGTPPGTPSCRRSGGAGARRPHPDPQPPGAQGQPTEGGAHGHTSGLGRVGGRLRVAPGQGERGAPLSPREESRGVRSVLGGFSAAGGRVSKSRSDQPRRALSREPCPRDEPRGSQSSCAPRGPRGGGPRAGGRGRRSRGLRGRPERPAGAGLRVWRRVPGSGARGLEWRGRR
ncbi:proline-rich protein 2-like [Talpa occidentalis]|uniref:proline-rich protein 2-like n=1 Tax=Talpa occidentalis TaxID=50954 RepID=UPI00189006EE|nr:proline-rich protein 2-like [Talpa occidentalis]